jgi:hypothetical protein
MEIFGNSCLPTFFFYYLWQRISIKTITMKWIKFFLISVPLALILLTTANTYFEIKRLIKWVK